MDDCYSDVVDRMSIGTPALQKRRETLAVGSFRLFICGLLLTCDGCINIICTLFMYHLAAVQKCIFVVSL